MDAIRGEQTVSGACAVLAVLCGVITHSGVGVGCWNVHARGKRENELWSWHRDKKGAGPVTPGPSPPAPGQPPGQAGPPEGKLTSASRDILMSYPASRTDCDKNAM